MIKRKLSSDFKKISIIIFVLAVILSSTTTWIVHLVSENKRKNTYSDIAEHLDRELIQSLTATESAMISIGRNILRIGRNNLKSVFVYMHEGIPDQADVQRDIYSWAYLDWIDKHNRLLINSEQGVLQSPIDLSSREYLNKSKKTPWKLVLGAPVLGIPSGEYVLPASLGVEDENGNYIGSIVVEFSIKKLREILMDISTDFSCEFFIVNEENTILLSSYELFTNNNQFFVDHDFGSKNGILSQPVDFKKKIEIEYQIKSKYYPFRIFLGTENKYPLEVIFEDILPKILAILAIAFVCIYMLMTLRNSVVSAVTNISLLTNHDDSEGIKKSNYQEIIQLASSIKKIKDFNKTLQEEVSRQTFNLQKALQAKQEFLNNISHEVRTPLQGILGISSELNKRWNSISDEDKKKYVRIMATSGDRLMRLMSDILDLSRFEEDKMSFSFKKCNLEKIIKESVLDTEPLLASNEKLKLKVNLKKLSDVKVKCDILRMKQVLNNLLSNAIKYSKEGVITIVGKNLKNKVRVSIRDEGVGISTNELETIFHPFIVGSRTKTKAGGKGLGLALCKEIIIAHGGDIWAESLDKGSIFHFDIPTVS